MAKERRPPARGAWIEINRSGVSCPISQSRPPARGAWIEIISWLLSWSGTSVAPRTGGVD